MMRKRKEFINLYSKAVLLANGGFAGIYPLQVILKKFLVMEQRWRLMGCTLVDMEFVNLNLLQLFGL